MEQRHYIDEAVVDIAFGSAANAFARESGLGAFASRRLMAVVESVLDDCGVNGDVLRIERLELDLGSMRYDRFQDEMASRLREQLTAAVREHMQGARRGAESVGSQLLLPREVALERIATFLRTGRIPRGAANVAGMSPDEMLAAAMRDTPSQLAAFLRRTPQRATVADRLASQFRSSTLREAARTLAPTHGRFLTAVVGALERAVGGERRRGLWATLFEMLLEPSAARADRQALLARFLAAVRETGYVDRASWHRTLNDAARATEDDEVRQRLSEFTTAAAPTSSQSTERTVGAVASLRALLDEAIRAGDAGRVRGIWRMVVADHPGLLRSVVERQGREAAVRRRLAAGFTDAMLRDIVRLIEPAGSNFIEEIIRRPELFAHADARPTEDLSARKQRLWEFTLAYLLVERGSLFNERAYMGHLTRQMAAHDNMRHEDLLLSLLDVLEETRVPNALRDSLLDLLLGLLAASTAVEAGDAAASRGEQAAPTPREESEPDTVGSTPTQSAAAMDPPTAGAADAATWEQAAAPTTPSVGENARADAAMRRALTIALSRGDPRGVRGVWRELVRNHPDLLAEAVRHFARQSRPRRLIAAGFPDAMLRDIVGLLEPAARGFIEQIVGHPELFRATSDEPPDDPDRRKRLLWEFTLAYLVVERGSVFNRRAYVAYLVRHMAARENVRYADLVDALIAVVRRTELSSDLRSELLAILEQLVAGAGGSRAAAEPAAGESPEVLRGYDLYAELTAGGPFGDTQAGAGVVGAITELARAYPMLLRRLVREWPSRATPLSRLLAGLSADGWLQVTRAVAHASYPADAAGLTVLLDTARARASSVEEPQRYYEFVLRRLALRHARDLTRCAEELPAVEAWRAWARGGRTHARAASPARLSWTRAAATSAVRGYLRYGARLSANATAAEDARAALEHLLRHDANRLRAMLSRSLRDGACVERLIDMAPETLLARVLRLRRPADHHAAQICADLVAHVWVVASVAASWPATRRAVWRHLFARFASGPRTFVEESFVASLVRTLARDAGRSELSELSQRLSERAPALAPVGTGAGSRARTQRVVAIVTETLTRGAEAVREEATESVAPTTVADARAPSESRSLIDAYDLVDRIMGRAGISASREAVSHPVDPAAIEQLAAGHPTLMLALYRQLRDGMLSARVTALARDELAALVRAFIHVGAHRGAGGPADLRAAITTHAREATDARTYYADLLTLLVRGRRFEPGLLGPAAVADAEAGAMASDGGRPPRRPRAQLYEALRRLRLNGPLSASEALRARQAVTSLLASRSTLVREELLALVETEDGAARLTDLLPEHALTRVLFLLRPREHARVQRIADILADATPGYPAFGGWSSRLRWRFVFRYIFVERSRFSARSFVRGYVAFVAERTGRTLARVREELARGVRERIASPTRELRVAVLASLAPDPPATPTEETLDAEPEPFVDALLAADADADADILVANAGMVLAAPYLTRLFSMMELTDGATFRSREAAERATHILQYMVDERVDAPEYELFLNKILCGVDTSRPTARSIDITDRERETVDSLVAGMIQNWAALGNTSVEGFRQSFLQRAGRMGRRDDGWHLAVDPAAFDMLLDRIPWSYSTVRLPWMALPMNVEWR